MSEEGPRDIPMALWPEVSAVPGAGDMLAALAGRHRIALATNATVSDRSMIERALERVSLRQYVSDIFCFRDIGARKDEYRFWQVVTSALVLPASELVMLGDSLEQDVLAPRRFGIHAVWFNAAGAPAPADVTVPVIDRLTDFPRLLEPAARLP